MRWLASALTVDGTLPAKEVKQRKVFLTYTTVAGLSALLAMMTALPYYKMVPLNLITMLVFMGALACGAVTILLKRPLTRRLIVGVLLTQSVVFLVWDMTGRTVKLMQWPLMVITIDMLLVMQVDPRYSVFVVCMTVIWIIVLAVEESFRFGLLDMPGTLPQGGEHGREEYFAAFTDCATLPCPVKFPPLGTTTAIAVFVLDFVFTRGFASDVLKEQASMERTINAVQEIASLLAKYDVEGVARMLAARGSELPEEMYETLQTMEENLRMYRPYLPAALFEEMEECESKRRSVAPPGVDNGVATVVFTDIRSSTTIWEHAPEGMRAGLKIHNSVMREVMQAFGGYEVKTIGDAFMIAFTSTQDGVNFGLRAHELLREAVWPDSLLEDAPICAEQGSLWGGLTVRIGVNTGPVTVEQNALTGRTDYFGHTVNVASRLESTCKPGAVAVPSDLYTSECRSCSAVVGDAEALDLKGVSGTTFVQCVWPLSLAGRKHTPLVVVRRCSALKSPDCRFGSESDMLPSRDSSVLLGGDVAKVLTATVGTIEVYTGDDSDAVLRSISARLATLTVSLDQSRGTLVSLLGNRVCVGWNLTRPAPAHMENAIRFAQRILAIDALDGAGLVSGPVQHGDVGARTQRFVTVVGQSVQRSWTLCDEAVNMVQSVGARRVSSCLYESLLSEASLPLAVVDMLTPVRMKLYNVVAHQAWPLHAEGADNSVSTSGTLL